MVQAVILSSFAVTCATLFLLLVPRPWRAHGSTDRHDGLGGIREVPAAPLPDLPPAGAARTIPAAVGPAIPAAPTVTPALTSPVKPPVRSGARNDGFARFKPARHAATDPAVPVEVQVTPTR
jgi:hypothetical protein